MKSIKTFKFAKTESALWAEAQTLSTPKEPRQDSMNFPLISGWWCFTDGFWKYKELFSGQG